jgi:DNA-binding MarR family transcriptional regulator
MHKSTTNYQKDISQITTYQSGIAQASAHRVINRVVTDFLLQYGLTSMQWFILGHIYDAGESGIRMSDLMRRVHTTLPYITNTVALLESKGTINKIGHEGDSRIKLVKVSASYISTVNEIESGLRDHLRQTLYTEDNIEREELQNYITVLYKIVQNS